MKPEPPVTRTVVKEVSDMVEDGEDDILKENVSMAAIERSSLPKLT